VRCALSGSSGSPPRRFAYHRLSPARSAVVEPGPASSPPPSPSRRRDRRRP
jgi:hypothetical protein